MHIAFNLNALLVSVAAVGGAWLCNHVFVMSERGPYLTAGALAVAIDLVIRSCQWKEIVAIAAKPKILTRDGPVIPRRNPAMELLQLLLGPREGGTFFHVIPAWLVGVALILLSTEIL